MRQAQEYKSKRGRLEPAPNVAEDTARQTGRHSLACEMLGEVSVSGAEQVRGNLAPSLGIRKGFQAEKQLSGEQKMDVCEPANQKSFPGEDSHFIPQELPGSLGSHMRLLLGSGALLKNEMRNGCLMGTGFLGGRMKMF